MKINLQRESRWLKDVSEQNNSIDCVSLRSGDGVSLSIPASFLAASSEYLSLLLHSHSHSCPHVNTVIYLPAVSGFSLKLWSQILTVGNTQDLSEENIKSCLENVEEVFELLRCEVKLVTKLSCSRASSQLKVVSFESLAQCTDQVKEEFKETVDVYKSEEMDMFNSHIEVVNEVGIEDCYLLKEKLSEKEISSKDYYHEKEKSRPLRVDGEGLGKSRSDLNHNMGWKPAHALHHDFLCRSSRKSTSRQDSVSDKGCYKNSFVREFQCSLCDLGFFTSVGLERHTSDKHGNEFSNKEFKCDDCNLSYYTENSLYKHKHEKHGSENSEDRAKNTNFTPHQNCVNWQGPFTCTMCDYSCKSPNRFSKHWNEKHTEATHRVSFIDTATSTTVTLSQVFAYIVRCRLCGILRCHNDSLKKAVLGITRHIQTNHHHQIGTGQLSNNYSVLQDQQESDEVDASVLDNPVVAVDSAALETVPTIGEFTSGQSLSKKGYLGPYHCLREGCSFVCDKFDRATKKLLMEHWLLKHGDVKCLLFLDVPSFTIINVKIICSNVGYCNYVGCDKLIYANKRNLYQTYVLNHWKTSHTSPADSFNPNMCKTISIKQVPDITEEEAAVLVRRPSICRMIMDRAHEVETSLCKCAIPGCGDNVNLMTYASHFTQKHTELPLNNILVTMIDGRKLTCQEVFKSAIQCGLCFHIRVGSNNSTVKQGMKSHWLREHKDMDIEEMSFINILPTSSDQAMLGSSNISTDMEQQLLDNVDGDSDEVSIEDLL